MTQLLFKLFIKDYKDTQNEKVRTKYGILSGIVGIVLNIILSGFKMIFGSITASVSITADGFNNLFDAISSIISLVGFKISGKPADKDHPFGHGRIEYISALILSFLIIHTGIDLVTSSIQAFSAGDNVKFSIAAMIVLVASILGKIWLAYFNTKVGKQIKSVAVDAVVKDSIGDIAATTATLIALIASKFTSLPVDAIMGTGVALLIIWSGISIVKDTMAPLLGEPPSAEVVEDIKKLVTSNEMVLGIHDLVVHSYGHSKVFASVHAEVPANVDILVCHDNMDNIESQARKELRIDLTIHMDPIETDNEKVTEYRKVVSEIIKDISPDLSFHDFRIVEGSTHTNLIFDIVLPYKFRISADEIHEEIDRKVKELYPNFYTVINFDNDYT